MSRTDEIYKPALIGKKLPVLTLDNKWYKLFTQTGTTGEIKELEERLNDLLKRQGKLNTESKEIRKLKAKLMDDIVALMPEEGKEQDKESARKQEQNQKLIKECNEKLDAYQDELLDLPKEIDEVNYELMLRTMELCYQQIKFNTQEIDEISEWINNIRIELKKNVIRKQEIEIHNQNLYSYMHDIFGADVIEIFDMAYNPEERKIKRSMPKGEIGKDGGNE